MKKMNMNTLSLLFGRLLIVFVFLWHGIPKAINPSMAMQKFVSMGFPGFLGPIIGWAEVILAVLVLVGFYSKISNWILTAIITVAVVFVHLANGVTAGLERDLLLIAVMLLVIAFGPGPYAINEK